jgi:hypothetical protein
LSEYGRFLIYGFFQLYHKNIDFYKTNNKGCGLRKGAYNEDSNKKAGDGFPHLFVAAL